MRTINIMFNQQVRIMSDSAYDVLLSRKSA